MIPPPFPIETVVTWTHTGSSYICDPPVLTSDIDYLVLTDNFTAYKDILSEDDWTDYDKYDDRNSAFILFRKGCHKLIVTESLQWYLKFAAATELAKKMNLLDKDQRIFLFDQVINNIPEIPEEPTFVLSTFCVGIKFTDPRGKYGRIT